jgi:peptide/nickel transport system substrate-binding protein
MKRILALLLCAVLLCGIFSGCQEDESAHIPTGDALDDGSGSNMLPTEPPKEQKLTMVYSPSASLNPFHTQDLNNRTLLPLLYQGLFSVGRDYAPTPILCQRYTVSPDMKTYTFYLAAARFSDGTTVTAADVAASYEAARQSAYYGGRLQHILTVTAVGAAVVMELDTPFQNLPLLLDIPIVKASEVDSAEPLGTGPYVMDGSLTGRRLRRQAAWWCKDTADLVVTSAYIPLVKAESPSQVRDEFEFRDVGLVCADPGSDHYADYRCDYEIWDCENGYFLYMGVNAKSKLFEDDTVRRALTHAIDRDTIVEEFYRGFARSATLPASPTSPYYDATLAGRYGYDSLKFTTALTDANLQGAPVTMVINSDDSLRVRLGRRIAKMLRECGLEVTLLELTTAKFTEHLIWGEYDLYLGQTKMSPNMDLTPYFKQYGSLNYGGMTDTTIHAMAREALANSGNYYNLHEMVMEDAQLIPILFRSYAVYATRGLVTDLSPARDNLFFYTLGRTLADARSEG